VSNPRVHLQEDGCNYSYGMVCFTCIGMNRLIGRTVCSIYSRLPEDEPSASKHAEDIKKLRIKILIYEMCISLVYIV